MRAARYIGMLVAIALLCGCASDDEKSKKAKKPKIPTPAERAERVCEAECAREDRCEDDAEVDPCMKACRNARTRRMHLYRARFVTTYAECLDRLPCDQDAGRCQAVAVAEVMQPPEEDDDEEEAGDDSGDDEKEAKSDEKKSDQKEDEKKQQQQKKKKKKKKKKKNPEEEKLRRRQTEAAEAARALFRRCHDRRIACDGGWSARCDASGAFNDGARERMSECLHLPCGQIRQCLQGAVSW